MNIGIEFEELEQLVKRFYREYNCRTCIKNSREHKCRETCQLGFEEEEYEQRAFKRMKGDYFKELGEVPENIHKLFNRNKLSEIRDQLEGDRFIIYEYDSNFLVKKKKGVEISRIPYDPPSKFEKPQVLAELAALKKLDGGNHCEAIRSYYLLWRLYNWIEKLTGLKDNAPQTIEIQKQTKFNKPKLSRDSLFLLFRYLKDEGAFLPNVKQQTINTAFQALTGYSAKQAKKFIHQKEIHSSVKNPKAFEELDDFLLAIRKQMKE